MSVSKSYWNSLDYASTSNTREVMKVYNPKTLKDFTQQHVAQMAPYPNQHFTPVASQGHQLWRSRAVTRHKANVRKKIRRGKRSNAKRNGKHGVHGHTGVSFNFLYVSVRGFKSKADSLYQLIEEQDIDILLLAETKVYTNTAINIKDF